MCHSKDAVDGTVHSETSETVVKAKKNKTRLLFTPETVDWRGVTTVSVTFRLQHGKPRTHFQVRVCTPQNKCHPCNPATPRTAPSGKLRRRSSLLLQNSSTAYKATYVCI